MILSTRRKIFLARLAYNAIMAARGLAGMGPVAAVRRRGISWELNLSEGIDFAIFLLGAFESRTVAAYKRLTSPGDIVVDIGANIGAHTLHLADAVGNTGKVLAFEPSRYAFKRLRRNIEINPQLAPRIWARQAMLVAGEGSVLAPTVYSSWPLGTVPEAHPVHLGVAHSTSGAEMSTLDQAIDKSDMQHVDLIKLDVDGHEMDVLNGGRKTLARFLPTIVMEYAPNALKEMGQNPRALLDLLRTFGYDLFSLNLKRMHFDGRELLSIPDGAGINVIARVATRSHF